MFLRFYRTAIICNVSAVYPYLIHSVILVYSLHFQGAFITFTNGLAISRL